MNRYDVAVIGLGPAGSILTKLISSDCKVAAIDKKSDSKDSFRKPCGGLLAPDAQRVLACLNLSLPLDVMVDPQIFSVRTYDLKTQRCRAYQRFYLNIDRFKFDMWLRNQIPDCADIYDNSVCTRIERTEDGYIVHFRRGEKEKTLFAKKIVGADGASSIVRNSLFPKKKFRKYTAVQQWFENSDSMPVYYCFFDKENTDCYSWMLSKDNSLIFGGAYPSDRPRERFEGQKKKLENIGIKLGDPIKTEACLVMRPASPRQFSVSYENAFLIGEAAGFVSPSSLEGISSAILSAVMLAKAINSGKVNIGRQYAGLCRSLKRKLFLKLLKCPFMYNSFLRNIILQTGLTSITTENKECNRF